MLVFNTTYTVPFKDARNFVIWIQQVLVPAATNSELLANPRLAHILTHKDPDTECFSLQFEVEDSAALHKWYNKYGKNLNDDMLKTFNNEIVGFSTMMEVIL